LEHFYMCCIFICNVSIFSVIFSIHSRMIEKLTESIDNVNSHAEFCQLFIKYNSMRSKYNDSVILLNTLFSTSTILGLLATYGNIIHIPIIKVNVLNVILIIIYILAEIIYFYSIYKVHTLIDHIKENIVMGNLPQKYMQR